MGLDDGKENNSILNYLFNKLLSHNSVGLLDVWKSMEEFEAFGKILIPILNSLKIDLGQPDIQKIFGIIKG